MCVFSFTVSKWQTFLRICIFILVLYSNKVYNRVVWVTGPDATSRWADPFPGSGCLVQVTHKAVSTQGSISFDHICWNLCAYRSIWPSILSNRHSTAYYTHTDICQLLLLRHLISALIHFHPHHFMTSDIIKGHQNYEYACSCEHGITRKNKKTMRRVLWRALWQK